MVTLHTSSDFFCVVGSLPKATTSVAVYLERQAVREPCSLSSWTPLLMDHGG